MFPTSHPKFKRQASFNCSSVPIHSLSPRRSFHPTRSAFKGKNNVSFPFLPISPSPSVSYSKWCPLLPLSHLSSYKWMLCPWSTPQSTTNLLSQLIRRKWPSGAKFTCLSCRSYSPSRDIRDRQLVQQVRRVHKLVKFYCYLHYKYHFIGPTPKFLKYKIPHVKFHIAKFHNAKFHTQKFQKFIFECFECILK